jgi:hypothetical protein
MAKAQLKSKRRNARQAAAENKPAAAETKPVGRVKRSYSNPIDYVNIHAQQLNLQELLQGT